MNRQPEPSSSPKQLTFTSNSQSKNVLDKYSRKSPSLKKQFHKLLNSDLQFATSVQTSPQLSRNQSKKNPFGEDVLHQLIDHELKNLQTSISYSNVSHRSDEMEQNQKIVYID
jgi:hypothetical protein